MLTPAFVLCLDIAERYFAAAQSAALAFSI